MVGVTFLTCVVFFRFDCILQSLNRGRVTQSSLTLLERTTPSGERLCLLFNVTLENILLIGILNRISQGQKI